MVVSKGLSQVGQQCSPKPHQTHCRLNESNDGKNGTGKLSVDSDKGGHKGSGGRLMDQNG